MGATTTLVTVQEFLQLPEPEGLRAELIGGEVVTMGHGKVGHEVVKKNVIRILVAWLLENPIAELFAETMFQLDDQSLLIPDVSVLFPGRITADTTGWIQGAPDIAVEIVSSETAATLEIKIDQYLTHGGKSVWGVFPEQRRVRIFSANGQSKMFDHNQALEDPVLPGFSVAAPTIFEGI